MSHPASAQTEAPQPSHTRLYVAIGAAMLILTLAAVFLVEIGTPASILIPIIAVMAVVQVLLQAVLFMHLRGSRRLYSIFFMSGAAIAVLFTVAVAILIQQWA